MIIDGGGIAAGIRAKIKKEVGDIERKQKRKPVLATILVGNDARSKLYLRNKHAACRDVGIMSENYEFEKIGESELSDFIGKLNRRKEISGILVQMPLPKGMNKEAILSSIDPAKDVDGLHYVNAGLLFKGDESLAPCTPKGVIEMLNHVGAELEGKNVVIIGRSEIVGKPLSIMLLRRNATVTVCHTRTTNLSFYTRNADIIISAAGSPGILTADMISKGSIVINVGMKEVGGRIEGDIDFDGIKGKASLVTPVVGGVGPLTVAMLLRNTVNAFYRQVGTR